MANPDFDQILASTTENIMKGYADQLCPDFPLLMKILKGRSNETGGYNCRQAVLLDYNPNGAYYQGYDTLKCVPFDGLSAIETKWAQFATCLTLCGFEQCVNSGSSEIVDLLRLKVYQTQRGFWEFLNADLLGNGGDPGRLTGLPWIVSDTKPFGGIDPANCAPWQSYVDDGGFGEWRAANPGAAAEGFKGTPLTVLDILNAITEISRCGAGKPDCIVTTPELYNSLVAQQLNKGTLSVQSNSVDIGLDSIRIGGIEVISDHSVSEGDVWILNTKHLKFKTLCNRLMKRKGPYEVQAQDARRIDYLSMFQLTTDMRRAHGLLRCRTAC